MGVKNDSYSGDGNTIKKIEGAEGTYKPSFKQTETDTMERLPQQQLPEAPAPKPFKIQGA